MNLVIRHQGRVQVFSCHDTTTAFLKLTESGCQLSCFMCTNKLPVTPQLRGVGVFKTNTTRFRLTRVSESSVDVGPNDMIPAPLLPLRLPSDSSQTRILAKMAT